MQHAGIWSAQSPATSALESNLPFCYDTMYFHEWLQYVFLPRMEALIVAKHALPESLLLLPMAEHAFTTQLDLSASALSEVYEAIRYIDAYFAIENNDEDVA